MTDEKRDDDEFLSGPVAYLQHLHDRGELADFMRNALRDGIQRNLAKLTSGKQNREAAEELLKDIQNHGADPGNQPDLYHWLYGAIDRVLDGVDANEALGLKRARRQRQALEVDPVAIAMFVTLKEREGLKPADAKRAAVEFFAREIRMIENAVRDVELNPDLDERSTWAYVHKYRRSQRNT